MDVSFRFPTFRPCISRGTNDTTMQVQPHIYL
jgi:hypothetical protein